VRSPAIATLLLLAVNLPGCRIDGDFRVRVLTPDGKPVAGALVSGGYDWDVFGDETDDAGFAHIPSWADGWDATITKDNFYTIRVSVSPCARYRFSPTPQSLKLVGEAAGTAVHFGAETLVTVGYQGQYRVYTYDDERVTLIDSTQIPLPVKHCLMRGDTFWYATHDSGLYAYSLRDLLCPRQLLHVNIYGYTGPFLVIDSFIIMGNRWETGPLEVYKYRPDGSASHVASAGSQHVDQIALVSHYVVTTGYRLDLPVIFDIADIKNPREVYHGVQTDFRNGSVFRNYVILSGADWPTESDSTCYGALDLTDPARPRDLGRFRTDSWFYNVVNESTVVGDYYLDGASVLKGSVTEGFRSVALVSRWPDLGNYECGGCAPPYFLLSNHLWKLVGPDQR
jgi:hypothetical protein